MASSKMRMAGVALIALIPLLARCDEDPAAVDDGNAGTVSAVVHDSSAVLPPGRSEPNPVDSVDYDGVLTGSAAVEIFSDGQGWVPIGETTQVDFSIYCEEAALVESGASVQADSYSKVRLTLTDFEAHVDSGAVLATVTVDSAFVVSFGATSPVVVEKSITPFEVTEGSSTTVIFDLNTELWLDPTVAANGTATAAAIQAATNVIIR